MKYWLGSLFHRNAHSLPRRVYFAFLRRLRSVFRKRQAVYFVNINGRRYKRVVLGDSLEAQQVESALMALPDGVRFPPLIHRHENELLMAFAPGRRFDSRRPEDRDAMAGFLGALYGHDRQAVSPGSMVRRLDIDLDFLVDVALIDRDLADRLAQRAAEVRPEQVLVGIDYVDPVEKNFVVDDEGICAIDVESLRCNQPLGTGIAKAAVHWLAREHMAEFVARVEQAGNVPVADQLEFVEICFLVGWTKRKLLQGKRRFIDIDRLREIA